MTEMNQWTGIGRVCTDIAYGTTKSGASFANFSLAIPRANKEAGPDYIDCTAWKNDAEYINKFIKKGDLLVITARLEENKWVTNEGEKRRKHILNFVKVKHMQQAKGNQKEFGSGENTFTELYSDYGAGDDEGLPF